MAQINIISTTPLHTAGSLILTITFMDFHIHLHLMFHLRFNEDIIRKPRLNSNKLFPTKQLRTTFGLIQQAL